uniref:ATP synthase F0 subunit 6 n=1 Tax=Thaparocleidus varicus TaxID=341076 RepID=A0A7L8ZQS8_9PLAT|nr:ATP synthase F0 subunit 6 [Thaparocleidus varicus]QOI72764.1 ATP synthase F0 subunit 6 [Thaparocleidus varicus]
MILVNRFKVFVNLLNTILSNLGFCFFLFLYYLLVYFLILRTSYNYNLINLLVLAISLILPLYLSLFFNRLSLSINEFFASLIPSGTPLWIAFFVGLAETISYVVRPFVLIIRPFLNITIGSYAVVGTSSLFVNGSKIVSLLLICLFFYEIFVAIVHWFIVVNILGFSIDH